MLIKVKDLKKKPLPIFNSLKKGKSKSVANELSEKEKTAAERVPLIKNEYRTAIKRISPTMSVSDLCVIHNL